ncbi:glycosyl transferase family A [Rhodococcoides trifolii]|uniref:Glycosyl transferase family A n=1 Tax=Rhodococcoides trifolii TaxID=908250 RepID=A0A917G2X8_9NOCA|nr:galactosyltransferase-related protein [Rhodococcus trifolii]GGG20126.1 glycosyl transferase family A [Rhodococcus trifolii]
MSTAVVTVVHGRHRHLANQLAGLHRSVISPDRHIVVSMGDPDVRELVGDAATVVDLEQPGSALPLAAARNLGARTALGAGCDVLIFLDVDCIPGTEMIDRYQRAVADRPRALACGPVTYLPAMGEVAVDGLDRFTNPHPARPNPPDGIIAEGTNYDLFWSLSFALTASTWDTVGGFCEDYTGYGGEDTDFAWTARRSGVGLVWVGGAHAYHQHHPVSSPPVEHLVDIVTNSRLFHDRWGRWPMSGWLDEFERRGLIERDDGTITLVQ